MRNKLEIYWSEESVKKTDQIILFLNKNWSEKEIESFLNALYSFEDIVTYFPEIYPESQLLTGYRRAVLLKHISIIYTIEHNTILIHTLFDNRQDPSNLTI